MSGKTKRVLNIVLILLVVLTVFFIWHNSSMSREASSNMSNGLLEKLRPYAEILGISIKDDILLRKLAHIAEYALLGMEVGLLFLLNGRNELRNFLQTLLLCILVAALDEVIQLNVGRNGHIHDVMLDGFGALCGAGLSFCIPLPKVDK